MPDGFEPRSFNPHDPAFLKDPYPTYALFRQSAPICPVAPYGVNWLFRYADCEQVLSDTKAWGKNAPGGNKPEPGPFAMNSSLPEGMFGSDPPLHDRLRGLVQPLFDEAITRAPALTEQFATPLLEAASRKGRIELISDYALRLPAHVLFTLLGIPDGPPNYVGVWEGLIVWQAQIAKAHDITQSLLARGMGATSKMALNTFFEGMALQDPPSAGLFQQICDAFEGGGLSNEAAQVTACDFVIAGYLSTTFVLGTGVRNLLQHPDQLQTLRADPDLYESALAEMMRYDGPVQIIDRVALIDTKVGGHQFRAGDWVSAVVGSAGRDPAKFPDAEDFRIDRSPNEHLGFGKGIHYCIGEPLVELVAPVALKRLLDEFPDLQPAGDPQWQTDPYLRAVANLPLQF